MAYTITDLRGELVGMLHGTSLDKIQNFYGVVSRAAREIIAEIDPMETKRISQLSSQVFKGVYDYTLPADLKGNKIIDLYPQVKRTPTDRYLSQYNQEFDIYKTGKYTPSFSIINNTGNKYARINAPQLSQPANINALDGITDNGTWAVGGNATDIAEDNIYVADGVASLKFNLSATGIPASTGYIENSTITSIDLSDEEDQGTLFYWVYLPTASSFTSVTLFWGSSNAAYWSSTSTTDAFGNAFVDGWNLIKAEWLTASQVGVPSSSAIDYVRITYTYDGTLQTATRADSITCNMGAILNIEYYSKYLFTDGDTGAWKEKTTLDNDIINLDTDSYNILVYLVHLLCTQQALGGNASFDVAFSDAKYIKFIANYKNKYKSEIQKPVSTYYDVSPSTWSKNIGRQTWST